MRDVLVSIIVPVYNVENRLAKCVESILAQTFKTFELILVNDGSTDNSPKILEDLNRNDCRIKVIHKLNGGAASARNIGLDNARGKYILFVDSDDLIHNQMLEILYNEAINNQSDIVMCDYVDIFDDSIDISYKVNKNYKVEQLTRDKALEKLCDNNNIKFVVPWNKLYIKEIFKNIRFIEGRICEDEFIMHRVLYDCNKVAYAQCTLYYYFQTENSVMRANFNIKRLDSILALKDRVEFFSELGKNELKNRAERMYVNVFFRDYYEAKQKLIGIDKTLNQLKSDFNKRLISLLKNSLFTWKEKIMILVFVCSPKLYELYNIKLKNTI